MSLQRENNRLLDLSNILQNQIETKRLALLCQMLVGPILKNLFDIGIRESDIVVIKVLIDILMNTLGKNVDKIDERQEIINNISTYSNLRLAKSKLKQEINSILNIESLENI
jgi:hypothetical protein